MHPGHIRTRVRDLALNGPSPGECCDGVTTLTTVGNTNRTLKDGEVSVANGRRMKNTRITMVFLLVACNREQGPVYI